MPDFREFFASTATREFTGTVFRICPVRFRANVVSMRGSFLYGARYNIRGYFGALYTSLSKETARREIMRYFTVPPMGGFVEASIALKLNRVVELTHRTVFRRTGIRAEDLIRSSLIMTQEIGLRAWEAGIEGLLAPSAANPAEQNLVLFLDNQSVKWRVELSQAEVDLASSL